MKRGKPPKRTALKPPTVEQVEAWRSKPRKRIPKVGARKSREKDAEDVCREQVKARAGGVCELAGQACASRPHPGQHMHHRCIADRDRGRHDPDRCLWLCGSAHRLVHDRVGVSYAQGWLVRDGIASWPE